MGSWVTGIRQICVVTGDLDAAVGSFANQLGIGPWKIWEFEAPRLYRMTRHGRAASYSMRLALAFRDRMQLEVIQPVSGDTVYSEFLATEPGSGAQHVMLRLRTGFAGSIRRLLEAGLPMVQSARVSVGLEVGRLRVPPPPPWLFGPLATRFAFFDGRAELGMTLEVSAYPPGISAERAWRLGRADRVVEATGPAIFSTVEGIAIACSDLRSVEAAWARAGFGGPILIGSIRTVPEDTAASEEVWRCGGEPGYVDLIGPSEPAVGAPARPRVAWVAVSVAAMSIDEAAERIEAAGAPGGGRGGGARPPPPPGPIALMEHPAFGSTPLAVRAEPVA